ncbi:LacI family DNA-binding transcriptional regulator [Croceitalea marina]|uniref:LacI family DNA-binding transcriptional regulator n=1 Tax=Croceitalea marina TaxID=1775166 RepID=A0ABW5MXA5_9FLAO
MTKVTLKDIADKLNISISTVSRALDDNPNISVRTHEKVWNAARAMGYVSDTHFAKDGLKQSNLIGVIVPKLSYHLYAMVISGIENILEQRGMHILICQSNESFEREKTLIEELIAVGVNGVIVSIASETKEFGHFEKLKSRNIPLVFFNRECNAIRTDKVVIDNRKVAHEAVNHLIAIGCENIAYLGGPESLQINLERAQGYKDALEENSIPIKEENVVFSKFDKESMLSAARKLLYAPNYPDGILTFSDQIAINLMVAAKERGIAIPEKLSVIGFNNEPVGELIEPSLTSIDQPAYQMGQEAAELLLKQMENENESFEKRILKSFLVVRKSTNRNRT